jgi:hypothetical protein
MSQTAVSIMEKVIKWRNSIILTTLTTLNKIFFCSTFTNPFLMKCIFEMSFFVCYTQCMWQDFFRLRCFWWKLGISNFFHPLVQCWILCKYACLVSMASCCPVFTQNNSYETINTNNPHSYNKQGPVKDKVRKHIYMHHSPSSIQPIKPLVYNRTIFRKITVILK